MLFRMSLNKEMKKKFNIGDRVRFLRDYDNEWEYADKGDCGTIESIDDNFGIRIALDSPEYITILDTDCIEPITPIDPKTAFLSDLADVLRKHNAVINVGWNDYFDTDKSPMIDIDIMFKDNNQGICFENVLGKTLTADNIMDYDKK